MRSKASQAGSTDMERLMQSSSRIVLAEKVLHALDDLSAVESARGHGFDVVDGEKVKWFPTAQEALHWIQYRRAEAVVQALDSFPENVETFAARFEEEFFANYPTDEASDEGLQLARAVLKPLVHWYETANTKRMSSASAVTLAFARFVGFMAYSINAATISRESGGRLQYLRDLLVDIGRAALEFQAEDDREQLVVDDLLTGEQEGQEPDTLPEQSIELSEDTPTEGTA